MPKDTKAQADLARQNADRNIKLALKNLDKLYINHGDQIAGKLSNLIQTAYNLAQYGGTTYQPQVQAFLNELVALADQKPLSKAPDIKLTIRDVELDDLAPLGIKGGGNALDPEKPSDGIDEHFATWRP